MFETFKVKGLYISSLEKSISQSNFKFTGFLLIQKKVKRLWLQFLMEIYFIIKKDFH